MGLCLLDSSSARCSGGVDKIPSCGGLTQAFAETGVSQGTENGPGGPRPEPFSAPCDFRDPLKFQPFRRFTEMQQTRPRVGYIDLLETQSKTEIRGQRRKGRG
jgi:hypothetical protein